MSEHLHEFATITADGEQFPATRENTTVFMHLGAASLYDHVYVLHPSGETAGYIFAQQPPENPVFKDLAALAIENLCCTHLNIPEASEMDIKAFIKEATRNIEDCVPEGWE